MTRYLLLILVLCTSCHPKSCIIEPSICYFPQSRHIGNLPSPFTPLSKEESQTPWGQESLIGDSFARELDLYRAITAYKRALVLISEDENDRRLQLEYAIVLCYYLGNKYQDAIEYFESSSLGTVPATFPAFHELMIILYDAYEKIGFSDRACRLLQLIEANNRKEAEDLSLSTAFQRGCPETLQEVGEGRSEIENWLAHYSACAKSPRKAQILNALLPGSGYLYVGQQKTALTSFLLNAAFIAASYQFFHHGFIAAGVITTSLEFGWYFGGINGAGLAAKEYNDHLWSTNAKEVMLDHRLFPVLMFQKAF